MVNRDFRASPDPRRAQKTCSREACSYRTGLMSHMVVEAVYVADAPDSLPVNLDRLLVGGPTHGFGMTRPAPAETPPRVAWARPCRTAAESASGSTAWRGCRLAAEVRGALPAARGVRYEDRPATRARLGRQGRCHAFAPTRAQRHRGTADLLVRGVDGPSTTGRSTAHTVGANGSSACCPHHRGTDETTGKASIRGDIH